jgi:hypothetical protein
MRIVIVGVCSTGKSTLEQGLRRLGYEAHSCVQEHAYVPDLWASAHPDLLVFLDASADTLSRRGETDLTENDLAGQRQRLEHARRHCDLYLRTDRLSADKVLRRVRRFVDRRIVAQPAAPE